MWEDLGFLVTARIRKFWICILESVYSGVFRISTRRSVHFSSIFGDLLLVIKRGKVQCTSGRTSPTIRYFPNITECNSLGCFKHTWLCVYIGHMSVSDFSCLYVLSLVSVGGARIRSWFIWDLGRRIQRIEFAGNGGSSDDTGFKIKVRANTAKFTNMRIARFG